MSRGVGRFLDQFVPPLLLFWLVLAAWHAAVVYWNIKPILLPGPLLVAQAVRDNFTKLLHAAAFTGLAAGCGFLASLIVGTLIAFVFSQSRWIRSSGYPYAIFLQTVPIIAIAPLIVRWCGRGFQSLVLTAFIISLFPMIANGTAGLLSIDHDLLDYFRLNNASRWKVLWKLRLPSAVPALCTGAKTACGLAVVGAIVGEFFAGYGVEWYGLGYLILFTNAQLRMAELFAAVLMSTLLGVGVFGAVSLTTTAILRRWYAAPAEHRT
jgi:NitT/TauT family transport system permease protein